MASPLKTDMVIRGEMSENAVKPPLLLGFWRAGEIGKGFFLEKIPGPEKVLNSEMVPGSEKVLREKFFSRSCRTKEVAGPRKTGAEKAFMAPPAPPL